jgi:hypothetical protein
VPACLATCLFLLFASQTPLQDSPPLYVFADIGDGQIGLINTDTDQLIQVNVVDMAGWPGNGIVLKQHAWVNSDGTTLYMSIDATPPSPGGIVVFNIHDIDWDGGVADLTIEKTLVVGAPGTPAVYPAVEATIREQPIMGWTQSPYLQVHGPSFRPDSPYSYATIWTDNRIIAIDTRVNEFTPMSPFSFGDLSAQMHGLSFNSTGTLALGTGYYYDETSIDLYGFLPGSAEPIPLHSFELRKGQMLGAFTHYTVWLNERYAYTVTQQFARTSLTSHNRDISSPGIWLLDIQTLNAKRVVGTADGPDDAGVFRSGSDVNIANGKLYIAEEDTLDGTFGDDGYVSIFDLAQPRKPRFIKRLKPGDGLPSDFVVAHGLTTTPDERFVFVASYASNYILKIDTQTDTVSAVWGADEGLAAPHGGFIAGAIR